MHTRYAHKLRPKSTLPTACVCRRRSPGEKSLFLIRQPTVSDSRTKEKQLLSMRQLDQSQMSSLLMRISRSNSTSRWEKSSLMRWTFTEVIHQRCTRKISKTPNSGAAKRMDLLRFKNRPSYITTSQYKMRKPRKGEAWNSK